MLKNHLLIALRVINRNKTFALINIPGLGLGMACCLLIFMFVTDELSFDKFQEHYDRIYRVRYHATNGYDFARVPPPIAPLMEQEVPGIEKVARLYGRGASVRVGEDSKQARDFEETGIYCADPAILDILTFNFIAGNPESALEGPSAALLTRETAIKYFGSAQAATGQRIVLQGRQPFTVAAVFEDMPHNSHISFNMLLPYESMYDLEPDEMAAVMRDNLSRNWVISHSHTYVLLKEGANMETASAHLDKLLEKHAIKELQVGQHFSLEPLRDFYLYSETVLAPGPAGNITLVYTFSGIALLTLLIACFNFINLTTAQSVKRAREVGVRKVMGASRGRLFAQFMSESLLVAFMGMVLAFFLCALSLPLFNELAGKELTEASLLNWQTLCGFGLVFLLAGLLGGSYPALHISRLNMLVTLKNKVSVSPRGRFSLRKILVVFQFALSVALVAATLVIFSQLNFMLNKPLGFRTSGIMTIPLFSQSMNNIFGSMNQDMRGKTDAFEADLLQSPLVKGVTLSSQTPGTGSVARMVRPKGQPATEQTFVPVLAVDYDFMKLFDMELLSGRSFDVNAGSDHKDAFIINQQFIEQFDWGSPEEAIGKTIDVEGKTGQVIGVVKDFHFNTLRVPVSSMVMHIGLPHFNNFSVRLDPQAPTSKAIFAVQKAWEKHFPGKAFEYSFLDTDLQQAYNNERSLGRIIGVFGLLAIVVSCMGSYGLAMFSARQREKEIGVRKVLGASFFRIIQLLFREFTVLYLLALLLALPAAWYATDMWLQDFSYRLPTRLDLLLLSGVLMLLVVWLTISYQSVKSAFTNPVKSLRSE